MVVGQRRGFEDLASYRRADQTWRTGGLRARDFCEDSASEFAPPFIDVGRTALPLGSLLQQRQIWVSDRKLSSGLVRAGVTKSSLAFSYLRSGSSHSHSPQAVGRRRESTARIWKSYRSLAAQDLTKQRVALASGRVRDAACVRSSHSRAVDLENNIVC